jgi:hypothetical protein
MAQPTTAMPMCPLAETCRGIMEKPTSGIALVILGAVFVALGIAIVFEPRIAAWLIAIALILLGAMLLFVSSVVRKAGAQFRSEGPRVKGGAS